ncbi:MAG TPA: hypothetical protein VFJ90_04020, partial [Candidatus Didemnitutus sp.]|nr:hypothetical protein [Candidatus Didemnitutus sp.]
MNPGSKKLLRYGFVVLIALAAWVAFLPAVYARAEIFTWDSAAYIDCARSILAGRGFMQRVIDGFGPEIWQPIVWWPPGYPLLIAAVASLGIDVLSAGVLVAIVSAAMAVALFCGIALRLFHWSIALPLTLGIAVMPAFLQISVTCMSDASYFALAAGSTLLLLHWSQGEGNSLRPLLVAGLLVGWSWG